jgi:uncharacterized membrane protein YcaP (DUF421 family)
MRWSPMRVVVNPQPRLVLLDGEFQNDTMRRQRVAEADVRTAVRQHGFAGLEQVGAVVLEADGTFSVVGKLSGSRSALADVPEMGGSNKVNKSK